MFSRRVALGQDPTSAAAAVGLVHLEPALDLHRRTGASLPSILDALARWHDDNAAFTTRVRASSSGAILSARMVAGLPLAGIPLLPAARAPLLDAPGVAALTTGLLLMVLGMRWIARLMPRPPGRPDAGLILAVFVSAALAGGSSLRSALDAVGRARPGSSLSKAGRKARLGQSWAHSLRSANDPSLAALAGVIDRALRTGGPGVRAVEEWAEARRADLAAGFEAQVARAPVKMVVPLTICVLPAFGLIAIVPFLRGLAGA
jgi:tight adherence protein B